MKQLQFIETQNLPIFEQLQLEEALLRASDQNFCLVNVGSPPAIVLGISGKVEEWVKLPSPLPLIRRFSGGGTVVVDEETLFVTLILNKADAPIEPFPKQVLEYKGSFYRPFFPKNFQVRENDYTIGEKKVGGNAQYFTKNRWLHHTTFLWNFTPEKMELLKHPPKEPSYRKGRPHTNFLGTLAPHFPSQQTFIDHLQQNLGKNFDLTTTQLKEIKDFLALSHRKTTKVLNE